jgi:hypothetical protein
MRRDFCLFSCKIPVRPRTDVERVLIMSIRRVAIGSTLAVFALSVAFAQQTIVIPDNLFTQAGFVVKYATTPEKTALLRSLPPDKLVTRRRDGKLYYVYADAER